jgi:hypothetical protein
LITTRLADGRGVGAGTLDAGEVDVDMKETSLEFDSGRPRTQCGARCRKSGNTKARDILGGHTAGNIPERTRPA